MRFQKIHREGSFKKQLKANQCGTAPCTYAEQTMLECMSSREDSFRIQSLSQQPHLSRYVWDDF